MRLLLALAFCLLAAPAFAELTMKEVKAAYRQNGIKTRITSTLIDQAELAKLRAALKSSGDASGALRALETGLSGATIHVVRYAKWGFATDFLEHNGKVVLAHFYMPIFSPTGASTPKGYLKVAQELSRKMTDNTVSAAGFRDVLEASITEAHAYADKTSRSKYPGVVFKRGKTWQYSAHALVPDFITLTVTRFPQCPYGYRKRGWVLQHICHKAR